MRALKKKTILLRVKNIYKNLFFLYSYLFTNNREAQQMPILVLA